MNKNIDIIEGYFVAFFSHFIHLILKIIFVLFIWSKKAPKSFSPEKSDKEYECEGHKSFAVKTVYDITRLSLIRLSLVSTGVTKSVYNCEKCGRIIKYAYRRNYGSSTFSKFILWIVAGP